MPLDLVQPLGGRLLAWAFALALFVAFVGLLAAASESLRREEGTFPVMEAVEPDLSLPQADAPHSFHDPKAAGWPMP